MIGKILIRPEHVPEGILSNLENRDIALWVRTLPQDPVSRDTMLAFLGLPWRLAISEFFDAELLKALEASESFNSAMTRKRGFLQVVDSDSSRIDLPSRCLPFYLLHGRQQSSSVSDFASRLRQMTMLEDLRRSGVREILVLSGTGPSVPPEMGELWASGLRAHLTFVSDTTAAETEIRAWLDKTEEISTAQLLVPSAGRVVEELVARYTESYPEDRHVLRVRDHRGELRRVDVTEADEHERPILEHYSLIEEQHLSPLVPEEISEEEFINFFRGTETSWRPYAAGLPWIRDERGEKILSGCLNKLDAVGATENCIAFVASESGAGGTTLVRTLAWKIARLGYPVLVAKPLPFVPDALPVVNFLGRVHDFVQAQTSKGSRDEAGSVDSNASAETRLYHVPWVIVFDTLHWQNREAELVRYRHELVKSGRPVCLLVVTSTLLALPFYNSSLFTKVAELNHAITRQEARILGRHLNQFLRIYGKERNEWQWDQFYEDHTVRYLDGIAAFWVTLSFWLQGQYDMSESIQEWIFRCFQENATDPAVRQALLEIAAMSSERLPLPEGLLPSPVGEWPVTYILEDKKKNLAALGLVQITFEGRKYWALAHDVLGRFLINALFYEFDSRAGLGFADARDAEHLRFMILRRISTKSDLGAREFRSLGEEFATSIFKVDPDHGYASFATIWRDVLDSLDNMPQSLRDTSRVFRHHTAVSRRRISKLDENLYEITNADRIALLNKAIEDIKYALQFINYELGSEPNLNLFNSLANAYFDLADVEKAEGADAKRINDLRALANDATTRAYSESPTNSHVIETYVKNILQNANLLPDRAVESSIEALGILFSALTSNQTAYRASQLGSLADKALEILLRQTPTTADEAEPQKPIDVLVQVWRVLAGGNDAWAESGLLGVPKETLGRVLKLLEHRAGRGNMQVIRLSFDLMSMVEPYAFQKQLEFVEQLQASHYRMTPQLRLEYACLLFQVGRPLEGEKVFRSLRRLWRETESFVYVPQRLRWLRAAGGSSLQTVKAMSGSDHGHRTMARVQQFGNSLVPFRLQEFGIRNLKPSWRFAAHVSFGHNGPFLRPVTAGPAGS